MKKVVVYTQPGCGPCMMVKGFLKNKGVEFEERNIREKQEYYNELINDGYRTTPVTYVDGKVIAGFDPEKLEKELGL